MEQKRITKLAVIKELPAWARRHREHIILMGVTLVLALLAFHWKGYRVDRIASVVIGDQGDTLTFTSLVWQAIDNLFNRPTNLGFGLFFYDDPAPLATTVAPYGIAVAVLPVYLFTGFDLELTMNLYILATFVLTAWAVYLLLRYLLRTSFPVAGLLSLTVAFAQFRFAHVVHIETLSTHLYLFCVYLLHRFLDEPRRKWAIGLAVVFWFTFFTSGYMGYMFLVTAAIIVAYVFLIKREVFSRELLRQALLAVIVAALIFLPFLSMRLQKTDTLGGYMLETIQNYSASPIDWLSGTSFIYFGLNPTGHPQTRGERTLFIGFIPLLLAYLGWRYRRADGTSQVSENRTLSPGQVVVLYGIITVAGYMLSLGPQWRFSESLVLPSPYMILLQIPGFSSLRVPARFIFLAVMGVAILGGWALATLERRLDRVTMTGLLAVLTALLAVELLPLSARFDWNRPSTSYVIMSGRRQGLVPWVSEAPVIPMNAYNWLAAQPPGTAVFHFPASPEANRQYMYGARFHKHPMINGQSSFMPRWYRGTDWDEFPGTTIITLLRNRDVRYVMVHNRFLNRDEQDRLTAALRPYLDSGWFSHVGDYDDVVVYELHPVKPERRVRVEFDEPVDGAGWHRPEVSGSGVTYTWTSATPATIDLLLQVEGDVDVEFQISHALTSEYVDSVRLTVNGAELPLKRYRTEGGHLFAGRIPLTTLQTGDDLVRLAFQTIPPRSPLSLGDGSSDRRTLGVALDWVELSPASSLVSLDFDGQTDGDGWHGPDEDEAGGTYQWMARARSTLRLPRPAEDRELVLVFRVARAASPGLLDSLRVLVNGRQVTLARSAEQDGFLFRARVSPSAVLAGGEEMELAFEIDRVGSEFHRGRSRPAGLALDALWLYPIDDVRLEFDSFPGADDGWHPPEVDAVGTTFRWTAKPVATFDLPLPVDRATAVEFRVLRGVTMEVLNSLALSVNGVDVPLTYDNTTGEHRFHGVVPQAAAAAAQGRLSALSFQVRQTESPVALGQGEDARQLGVALDWLALHPVVPGA